MVWQADDGRKLKLRPPGFMLERVWRNKPKLKPNPLGLMLEFFSTTHKNPGGLTQQTKIITTRPPGFKLDFFLLLIKTPGV